MRLDAPPGHGRNDGFATPGDRPLGISVDDKSLAAQRSIRIDDLPMIVSVPRPDVPVLQTTNSVRRREP